MSTIRQTVSVSRAVDSAIQAVTQENRQAAKVVTKMKREVNRMAAEAAGHQAQRLVAEEPNRLPAYKIEMDVLQNLKRVYYYAKRMARAAVPTVDIGEAPQEQ